MWSKYDVDNSGVLKKAEAMNFLRDTYKKIFGTDQSDEKILSTFKIIDKNSNQSFKKDELIEHIKVLVNL